MKTEEVSSEVVIINQNILTTHEYLPLIGVMDIVIRITYKREMIHSSPPCHTSMFYSSNTTAVTSSLNDFDNYSKESPDPKK